MDANEYKYYYFNLCLLVFIRGFPYPLFYFLFPVSYFLSFLSFEHAMGDIRHTFRCPRTTQFIP